MNWDEILNTILSLQTVQRYHMKPLNNSQTVGDHSWGVAILTWVIASELYHKGYEIDRSRCLINAILHDVPEVIVGDAPWPTKNITPEFRKAWDDMERKAWNDWIVNAGCKVGCITNFMDPVNELEEKVLKLADALELLSFCVRELKSGNQNINGTINNGIRIISELMDHRFHGTPVEYLIQNLLKEAHQYGREG